MDLICGHWVVALRIGVLGPDEPGWLPATDADGNPVVDQVTDASGHYLFDNLIPGAYQVQFVLPNGAVVSPAIAPAGTTQMDCNPDSTGLAAVTIGLTEAEMTTVDPAVDGTTVATMVDRTIDAGLFFPLAIGDDVWYDADHDGVQDSGETPVAGVTVNLLMDDGSGVFVPALDIDGNAVVATTRSSSVDRPPPTPGPSRGRGRRAPTRTPAPAGSRRPSRCRPPAPTCGLSFPVMGRRLAC